MVTISGTVTDDEGNNLENVEVWVINEATDSVAATTTTASDGTYSVTVGSDFYHVIFYYVDGSKDYNTNSKPYVQ
jgi:hypothetical protein